MSEDWKAYVDGHGDMAPPWARFPDYERHTIGWRMGLGETWMHAWRAFLQTLAPDRECRLAYLRRHPPAPYCWSDAVHAVLSPSAKRDAVAREELVGLGLVEADVAYRTWRARQPAIVHPWTLVDTPEEAARHRTRELWFWSRQVAEARTRGELPPFTGVPDAWKVVADAARTGIFDAHDTRAGLQTIAGVIATGDVRAPWQLGLTLSDFADSFDDDMGYVDAFRLWGMAAFDDAPTLDAYLDRTGAPAAWRAWAAEQWPQD